MRTRSSTATPAIGLALSCLLATSARAQAIDLYGDDEPPPEEAPVEPQREVTPLAPRPIYDPTVETKQPDAVVDPPRAQGTAAEPYLDEPIDPYLDDQVSALWFGPLGPLAFPIVGLAAGRPMGWLQFGGSSSLTRGTALVADIAVVFSGAMAVVASVGPQFSFGRRALTGFFVLPKLIVEHVDIDPGPWATSGSVQLGADLGWQFDTGRFYAALVVGASVGYGWNHPSSFTGQFGTGPLLQRMVVVGLNPNVFRLGMRF